MSIPQPNLYTKKYKDICNEMLESIPKYTDKWTNHNPSDPGITILEMLAWIGEIILYRIDRIPEKTYISFLRLVAGTAGIDDTERLLQDPDLDRSHKQLLEVLKEIENGNEKSVEEIKEKVLIFLNSRYRAVTEEDFRKLTIESTDLDISPKVKRAIVSSKVYASGKKVEIIIVPNVWAEYEFPGADKESIYNDLIKRVSDYLDPRRLIGTIVEVKKPDFTHVRMDISIISNSRVKFETVKKNLENRIVDYLDPLTGGPQGKGWPYGRPLTVYEIAQVVEETEGVEKTCRLCLKVIEKAEYVERETEMPIKGLILVDREEGIKVTEVKERCANDTGPI